MPANATGSHAMKEKPVRARPRSISVKQALGYISAFAVGFAILAATSPSIRGVLLLRFLGSMLIGGSTGGFTAHIVFGRRYFLHGVCFVCLLVLFGWVILVVLSLRTASQF